jgi:hypothetical protein
LVAADNIHPAALIAAVNSGSSSAGGGTDGAAANNVELPVLVVVGGMARYQDLAAEKYYWMPPWTDIPGARCAFPDRHLHPRSPLDPMHSSRKLTFLLVDTVNCVQTLKVLTAFDLPDLVAAWLSQAQGQRADALNEKEVVSGARKALAASVVRRAIIIGPTTQQQLPLSASAATEAFARCSFSNTIFLTQCCVFLLEAASMGVMNQSHAVRMPLFSVPYLNVSFLPSFSVVATLQVYAGKVAARTAGAATIDVISGVQTPEEVVATLLKALPVH